jgi:hypothetical protein
LVRFPFLLLKRNKENRKKEGMNERNFIAWAISTARIKIQVFEPVMPFLVKSSNWS